MCCLCALDPRLQSKTEDGTPIAPMDRALQVRVAIMPVLMTRDMFDSKDFVDMLGSCASTVFAQWYSKLPSYVFSYKHIKSLIIQCIY